MKFQKLILSAATAFLMVGGSGAAMAVDCANGRIIFETVPEIVIDGQSCFIYAVTVEGKVTVTNSPVLNMSFTNVGGPMTIKNGENASVFRVDVLKGNLVVNNYDAAVVLSNTVKDGVLKVNNNLLAVVWRNTVTGNIKCTGNEELEAAGNRATGTEDCFGL
jgi:hypothetical protein